MNGRFDSSWLPCAELEWPNRFLYTIFCYLHDCFSHQSPQYFANTNRTDSWTLINSNSSVSHQRLESFCVYEFSANSDCKPGNRMAEIVGGLLESRDHFVP